MSEKPLQRPHYFSGKLLTAEDLQQEQNYSIDKSKRHNRSLHGFGIVSGLKVKTKSGKVIIDAGLALDCTGNEIVVETPQTIPLPPANSNLVYIGIKYQDECAAMAATGDCAIITEAFEISIDSTNYLAKHRHSRGRWICCGMEHPLTIARLRMSTGQWRVDSRYRPSTVK